MKPLRILVAVTLFGNGKDYVLPKFKQMAEHCMRHPQNDFSTIETDVRVYGDHNLSSDKYKWIQYHHQTSPGFYAEDMLMKSREQARLDAIREDYDLMVWHGVDALWQKPYDFYRLAWTSHIRQTVVSPLIAARTDENQAVCRRFKKGYRGISSVGPKVLGLHWIWAEEQEEIDEGELLSGELIETGFPGADNMFIPKKWFNVSLTDGHDPWYKRVAQGRANLCCEENWVRNVLNQGANVYCDTKVKVWHVHEDGTARMYKGITERLENLHWPAS